MDSSILDAFQAENLLQDSQILTDIKTLVHELRHASDGTLVSYDEIYLELQGQVDGLERLKLEQDIAPGTENQYQLQLITAIEKVQDDCDRVLRKTIQFESLLKNAQNRISRLKATFSAWFILAAGDVVKRHEVKLPPAQLKDMAAGEFSRLLDGVDVQVDTILASIEALDAEVKQHKKTQREKFDYGKDQVNASWTSGMPAWGNAIAPSRSDQLLKAKEPEEDLEEDVPAFVSKRPTLAEAIDVAKTERRLTDWTPNVMVEDPEPTVKLYLEPVSSVKARAKAAYETAKANFRPEDIQIISVPATEDEIKGTFVKTGDPQPTVVVSETPQIPVLPENKGTVSAGKSAEAVLAELNNEIEPPKTPRKRLILDAAEEELL